MIVLKSTFLPCPFERCGQQVLTTRVLKYVAWPLVTFEPVNPPELPEQWNEQKYVVRLLIFGFIPFGRQTINISFPSRSDSHIAMRDNGYARFISKWDHLITIRAVAGGCAYSDRVEVSAGVLTPFVWAFAWLFFRHRQRRWLRLVGRAFDYEDS
jgi:hypothetical protein